MELRNESTMKVLRICSTEATLFRRKEVTNRSVNTQIEWEQQHIPSIRVRESKKKYICITELQKGE